MSLVFKIMYAVGFTPWDRARSSSAASAQINRLFDREETRDPAFGKALDMGCGRGADAVNLARRGWQVTAVDNVGKAVESARSNVAEAGVDVDVVLADVTTMARQVGRGYRFVLDRGCFHALGAREREAVVREVDAITAPGATLLLLAFQPGRRFGPLPRGVSRDEVVRLFEGWSLIDEEDADVTDAPRPVQYAAPRIYRLRKAG